MEVIINKKAYPLVKKELLSLLQFHGFNPGKGMALAINNTVIPKQNWDSYQLNANDTILIIKATQGG